MLLISYCLNLRLIVIIKNTHIVPEGISGIRFSDYAQNIFNSFPTKSGIKKAIKRGELLVGGNIYEAGRWVKPGQRIDHVDLQTKPPKSYHLSLDVVYEDEYIAVINKPAGIVVSGNQFRSIVNALRYNLKPSKEKDVLKWAMPVHRLDYQTSGLLLVAKTTKARIELGKQFENKEIKKRYKAIVIGRIQKSGRIDQEIEGKKAITEFTAIHSVPSLKNKYLSLVDLYPLTGRTHQLRIHMADYGFPILGDNIYGTEGMILRGKGLFLCAVELSFKHPVLNTPKQIIIKEPEKFMAILNREKRRWEKYN